MSAPFEKARRLAADGKHRSACESLYYAVPIAIEAGDRAELRGIIDLANQLSGGSDRKVEQDCEEIMRIVHDALDRESGLAADLRDVSLVFLAGCRIIGGAGLPVQADAVRAWSLAFTDDRVVLFPSGHADPDEILEIGWTGLEIAVEGAGAITKGGGFIGGGFGIEGAAVGMLTASVLNALTTSSQMDTVLRLQTADAEVYLFYGAETPEALRRSLSPVFLRLRQQATTQPSSGSGDGHVVDRLHKLADLLDRGLIDKDEFAALKADLMKGQ